MLAAPPLNFSALVCCTYQAIVYPNGMFLHIGPPTIRLLPVELLLEPKRQPMVRAFTWLLGLPACFLLVCSTHSRFAVSCFDQVFRPKLTADERDRLLDSLQSLIGHKYNTIRVYSFIGRQANRSFSLSERSFMWFLGCLVFLSRGFGAASLFLFRNLSRLGLQRYLGLLKPLSEADERGAVAKRTGVLDQLATRFTSAAGKLKSAAAASTSSRTSAGFSRDPLASPASAANSQPDELFICTDAILNRMLAVSPSFRAAADKLKFDYALLRSWSINDILVRFDACLLYHLLMFSLSL